MLEQYVTRHPISRAIAGDYNNNQKYPQIFLDNNGTEQDWWNFAKEKRNDNFVLHALSDATCCAGPNTDRKYLEMAKDLVQRFTFVLDIGCLDRGLEKVADILGLEEEFFIALIFGSRLSAAVYLANEPKIGVTDLRDPANLPGLIGCGLAEPLGDAKVQVNPILVETFYVVFNLGR